MQNSLSGATTVQTIVYLKLYPEDHPFTKGLVSRPAPITTIADLVAGHRHMVCQPFVQVAMSLASFQDPRRDTHGTDMGWNMDLLDFRVWGFEQDRHDSFVSEPL